MIEEKLVAAREAAQAVGMSVKAGRVPAYAVGPKLRGVRFSIPELRESLKRERRGE
jgi:hypothetical protein